MLLTLWPLLREEASPPSELPIIGAGLQPVAAAGVFSVTSLTTLPVATFIALMPEPVPELVGVAGAVGLGAAFEAGAQDAS